MGLPIKNIKQGNVMKKVYLLAVVMTITAILAGCNKGEQ